MSILPFAVVAVVAVVLTRALPVLADSLFFSLRGVSWNRWWRFRGVGGWGVCVCAFTYVEEACFGLGIRIGIGC